MKAMISQPMNGKTDEEILKVREKAVKALMDAGFEVADTFFNDIDGELEENEVVAIPVYFLAKSLAAMSQCNAVYFCHGWEEARGCRIEHDVAKAYGLEMIYEE